jgi:beta propeller repeat protein
MNHDLMASARRFRAFFAGVFVLLTVAARAQEQFQGVCSQVKIVIDQTLTIERIGYLATLEVTDNDGTDPITDFSAQLTFENPSLSSATATNDASALFFVQQPKLGNINDVGGSGVIAPTTKATVSWFIIPKTGAGGTTPNGVIFRIGCSLSGKIRGVQIPSDVLFAVPAVITVKPEPLLDITYFQPRDVMGDDPFTPQVESPVPFTLGVIVKNSGYATAKQLKVDSQQPKIVENINGLLLIAQLLGVRVNDSTLNSSSLQLNLGDILPGAAAKGAWDMIVSISGTFIEFKASYTHSSDLGGQATSLIRSLNAYFIAHEVLDDQPGRDTIKDFLADTNNDADNVPNALFESQGDELAVNYLTNNVVVGGASAGGNITVNVTANVAGWGYIRVDDPGQSKLRLQKVVRSDGKVINTNNFWTNYRYTKIGNVRQNFLNIFDLVDLATYNYTVTYAPAAPNTNPPVTTIHFAGDATAVGDETVITPATQVYFISEDVEPVAIVYSLTNGPFVPAIPFTITTPGTYQVRYYATDASNNRETTKTNTLIVTGSDAIAFSGVDLPAVPIYAPGDALSVRPFQAPITFSVQPNPSQVNATVDILAGALGWATVGNVPSSPTTNKSAVLTVAGDNVNFYKYALNGGAWSGEAAVAAPLKLANLSAGTQTLAVLGRSAHGGYLDPSNAVTVTWVVDPAAPPTTVTNTPATPTHSYNAALGVSGAGVSGYRWTINGSYYRPETPPSAPIVLTGLTAGPQVVSVVGDVGGTVTPTNNSTTVAWTIDPNYGYGAGFLPVVRSVTYTNVGSANWTFAWDGRDDAGVIRPAGWYTARITLTDQVGHSTFATRLIQIGDLAGSETVLADTTRGPKNPDAKGHWAVWEDQSTGNWQIYARDLAVSGATPRTLTTGSLAQENPRTDGRYVVWQGRQPDGSWDVYLYDLSVSNAPVAVTSSPGVDEINPVIDWPWVIYQTKPTGAATSPWQIYAINLETSATTQVSPSTQDELNPAVQAGRVVWEDERDVGQGEIYFKNLETGVFQRITTNIWGQYHPAIAGDWIVWQDNRNGQVDIYGYDLRRQHEVRVTSTPEDETRPKLDGPWVVCAENSLGPLTGNLRLIHLETGRMIPVTRTATFKDMPALSSGRAVWLETPGVLPEIVEADLPSLQAVFENRNAVAVTAAMAAFQTNAFSLLALWQAQAGITEIVHYKSLAPSIVTEKAQWVNGGPSGSNFQLTAGDFLWVRFASGDVLDLGVNAPGPFNLPSGPSILSYTGFPSGYGSYRFLQDLGVSQARAVRMLDAQSGRWLVASYSNGQLVGDDFPIPGVAVLMVDMITPVNGFTPTAP